MRKNDKVLKRLAKRKHERSKELPAVRFLIIGALLSSHLFLATQKHGVGEGLEVTALTWAFLIFLTPVPIAGVLLELPLKIFTKHRMMTIQTLIWGLGIIIAGLGQLFFPNAFEATTILKLFRYVLQNPMPYWGLLGLCAAGTFLSVFLVEEFVDEIKDELMHRHRKHLSALHMFICLLAVLGIIIAYWVIVGKLGLADHIEWF
jgi:hypothetical protein